MPRRKRSGANPLPYILGGVIVIGLAAAAYFLLRPDNDPFPDIEHLKQDLYVGNANSLQGTFKVYGMTVGKVDYETEQGSLWRVKVTDWEARGDGKSSPEVGILVPNSLKNINLKPSQEFAFKVTIARERNRRGVLVAQEVTSL